MEIKICPECLYQVNGKKFCPYCGFNIAGYTPKEHHLPPGTVIGERYVIGRAIGEGGFGITYTAADIKLGGKFAVKEYYPSSISGRSSSVSDSHMICPFTGNDEEFNAGLVRFENEARRLAQFDGKAGIVNVKDYICENGTGYIVMEYAEGISLEKYLENNGGKVNIRTASDLIKPIVLSLSDVHKSGIIHRDISPDNIIVTENNGMVLIDFGSARQYDSEKSMSVILKFGYAPYEQYSRHGNQGPWTDVYALCAVIYRMITGKKPPDAVERLQSNVELDFSECEISEGMERALRKGLEIKAADRFQSMDEFYSAFYKGIFPKEKKKGGKKAVPVIAAAAAVIICIGAAAAFGFTRSRDNDIAAETTAEAVLTEQTTAETEAAKTVIIPEIIQKPLQQAEKKLSELGINYTVEYVESLDTATGNVVSLTPEAGTECSEKDNVTLFVNSLEVEMVPDLSEMSPEQAEQTLTALGFKYETAPGEDYDHEDGVILGQSAEKDTYMRKGDTVTFTVNTLPVPLVPSMPDPDKFNWYSAEMKYGYPDVCDIDYIMSRYKDDLNNYKADIHNDIYNVYGTESEISAPSYSTVEYLEILGFSADDPEFWYIADDFDYDGRDEYYLFTTISTNDKYIDADGNIASGWNGMLYFVYSNLYYIDNNGDTSFMFNFQFPMYSEYPTIDKAFTSGNSILIIDYGDCKHLFGSFFSEGGSMKMLMYRNKFFSPMFMKLSEANNCLTNFYEWEGDYVYMTWDGTNYIWRNYINGYVDPNDVHEFYGGELKEERTVEWHITE